MKSLPIAHSEFHFHALLCAKRFNIVISGSYVPVVGHAFGVFELPCSVRLPGHVHVGRSAFDLPRPGRLWMADGHPRNLPVPAHEAYAHARVRPFRQF